MPIKNNSFMLSAAVSTAVLLSACSGDDGDRGAQGDAGAQGASGLQSLIAQSAVSAGHEQCFQGGVQIDSGVDADVDGSLGTAEISETSYVCNPTTLNEEKNFNRVASFLVCSQIDPTCDTDTETAAEIVAASVDGMTLIYSDSPANQIGFVDITDPSDPQADGTTSLTGEPTSVAVKGNFALVGVNTSTDFVTVGGHLEVINIILRAKQVCAVLIWVASQILLRLAQTETMRRL